MRGDREKHPFASEQKEAGPYEPAGDDDHTAEEKEMILKRYPYYKDDMIMLWDSLRKDGYTRSYASLVRVVNKWIKPEIKKKLH